MPLDSDYDWSLSSTAQCHLSKISAFVVSFWTGLKTPEKFLAPSNPEFICTVMDAPPSSSAKFMLRHSGCSHWISPELSTFSVLEFYIASVSASSVLNDLSFNDLPCVFTRDSRMVRADQI